MQTQRHYLLYSVLCAVELRESQDGLRNGSLARIPPGSDLEVYSIPTTSDGMVVIGWLGRKYAVFLEDLQDRGELAESEPEPEIHPVC